MNDMLKGEWDFDGFVESDWTAVAEMRACPPKNPDTGECGHGVAADGPEAAALALNSGVDSEMTSTLIRDFGAQLLADGRDLDGPHRRRGAPDPAREVPRRPVREPVLAVRAEQAEAQMLLPDARRGRPQRREPLDGAAQERRRDAAARTRPRRRP